jgi:arsenate reductase-like glutaredoxin family protein
VESLGLATREVVDTKKMPMPASSALTMARKCDYLVSGRGAKWKKIKISECADEELEKILLGRSGNLKAPTIRVGKHLLVGWCEAAWLSILS